MTDLEIRIGRKGLMSAAVFYTAIGVFLLAHILLLANIRNRAVASESLISDRIYYVYEAVEYGAAEIIEEELGNETLNITMNVSVQENEDDSIVVFTEKLPQDVFEFKVDLNKYERFVETYVIEPEVAIDTSIGNLGGSMESIIEPYEIIYTHEHPWGDGTKRQFEIKPSEDNPDALDDVQEYRIFVQLIGNWEVKGTGVWAPEKSGDLIVNITVLSTDGDPMYTTEDGYSRTTKSVFQLATEQADGGDTGWISVEVSDAYDSGLEFEMHKCEGYVSTAINLTDIPGQTSVDYTEGKINVRENIYLIEKNGTVGLLDN